MMDNENGRRLLAMLLSEHVAVADETEAVTEARAIIDDADSIPRQTIVAFRDRHYHPGCHEYEAIAYLLAGDAEDE